MSDAEYPLALELLAIGRVFFFKTAYTSSFAPALVPYRMRGGNGAVSSTRQAVFNPELGRSVSEMLTRTIMHCARQDWARAEEWCSAAARVKTLGAMYRGSINIALAAAIVEYYSGVVALGACRLPIAYKCIEDCAEQLAFTSPDRAAAAWLALARLDRFQGNPTCALWALQKCEGLMLDMDLPALEILKPLVAVEYNRITVNA